MNYTNLTFHRHLFGFQATCQFENTFGLSILPEWDSEGYEVAVTRNGILCYDSGLTEDIFRHLSVDEVHNLYDSVQNLSTP